MAINNTVQQNPFAKLFGGLVAPPKQQASGPLDAFRSATAGSTPVSPFQSQAPKTGLAPSGQYVTPRPQAPVAQAPQQQAQGMSIPEYQAAIAAKSNPLQVQAGQNQPVQQAAPVQAVQPVQQPKGLLSYPGLVGQVAQASAPSATQTGLVQDLSKVGRQNQEIAEQARLLSADYGQRIAETGQQTAGAVAGAKSTGTNLVGSGNAAIASQSGSAQMQALAAAQSAALAGTGQALTANQQQAAALTSALGGANTQQGQQLTGLSSAAGLAQPSPAAFGQTTFDPLQGGFSGEGGLPSQVLQQYAQMAVSGQYSAIPSFITSNPVLNAQLNVAAKSLDPKFTPVGAQGASNVLQNLPALQSAETQADGIKNSIIGFLNANPSVNPSELARGNQLKAWIEGKELTDPKYQVFFNYLNEYTNTLAPILGVGGDPTNFKTEIAQRFVNAAASGASIAEVLNATSVLAKNKLIDMQRGALGGGTSVPSQSYGQSTGGFAEAW